VGAYPPLRAQAYTGNSGAEPRENAHLPAVIALSPSCQPVSGEVSSIFSSGALSPEARATGPKRVRERAGSMDDPRLALQSGSRRGGAAGGEEIGTAPHRGVDPRRGGRYDRPRLSPAEAPQDAGPHRISGQNRAASTARHRGLRERDAHIRIRYPISYFPLLATCDFQPGPSNDPRIAGRPVLSCSAAAPARAWLRTTGRPGRSTPGLTEAGREADDRAAAVQCSRPAGG
jgi:hypothetical protein